ncbi:MAG: type II secretion system F family protein [Clostridiales bacterium]|uniref:type II secretion system F family protein n=1 Tax=uncultured Eubacterium sp. TaxID=165185 RepID=UPI0025D716E4|nr:type II secretion system F family protein [uncultured Eubacterium sp.]MBD8929070.1 type II secretion system F family protein [Clostridiales bacterium]
MVAILVIAYSLFVMVLCIVIFGKKGKEEDNNLKRMKSIGKEVVTAEYKNVETSFYDRNIKPIVTKLASLDEKGNKQSKSARKRQETEKLALQLRKAGMHMSTGSFNYLKLAVMVVGIILSVGIGLLLKDVTSYYIMIIIVGSMLSALSPTLVLNAKIKKHQGAIRAQLPDTLDLLSVCMEAGLSFDASLLKVSERMEGPLIDELVTVFRQIQLGKSRNDALKTLSDSTDVSELKTFISAVIQANTLGIPITNVLAAQSEQLRIAKREQIKEKAAKVPSKMTIPTVLLILPAIICVIMGPVVIQVKDQLAGGLF